MKCRTGPTVAGALAFSAGLLWLAASPARAQPTDCDAVRCAAQPSIDALCPCDSATNHGKYVKCVKDAVKTLGVPNQCRGAITSCAARSVCGKEDAVTCDVPDFGRCNKKTGLCEGSSSACGSFVDCPEGTTCKVKKSEAHCLAKGGTVRSTPSCCECPAGTTTSTTVATTSTTTSSSTAPTATTTSTSTSTSTTVGSPSGAFV